MFVRGHDAEHGKKYGGGYYEDANAEAKRTIRLNYKLDLSFCTKYAALDFV